MARIDTLRGLIELIAASKGGKIESRIKIHKEAFLLATRRLGRFSTSNFNYHHYGPYSRDLSDAVQLAVSSNLVDEERDDFPDGAYRYSYKLTDLGRKFLEQSGDADRQFCSKVDLMSAYHWRTLELAATVRYLELHGHSNVRNEALEKAIQLKPETQAYRQQAEELLQQIEA